MNLQQQRKRRANTIKYLTEQGLTEGQDWHWGAVDGWNRPGVIDNGDTVEVDEKLTPTNPADLPIMIRSSGVRLIGGPGLAKAMDDGLFPSEMPFMVAMPHGLSAN